MEHLSHIKNEAVIVLFSINLSTNKPSKTYRALFEVSAFKNP